MKKKKQSVQHNTWSHRETMLINLRDWVNREVHSLRLDLAREVPHLEDDPSISRILKSAEDLNVQLFDLIRSVVDRAEVEAKKLKKTAPPSEPTADDDAYVEEML